MPPHSAVDIYLPVKIKRLQSSLGLPIFFSQCIPIVRLIDATQVERVLGTPKIDD
jgi:hypothetical protein